MLHPAGCELCLTGTSIHYLPIRYSIGHADKYLLDGNFEGMVAGRGKLHPEG